MSNKESFHLLVETRTYRDGIRTTDVGVVNDRTRYGLEKLSEALYVSASLSAQRHGEIELMKENSGVKRVG